MNAARATTVVLWLHGAFLAVATLVLVAGADSATIRDTLTSTYLLLTLFATGVVLVNAARLRGRERASWLLLGGASACWHLTSVYLNLVLVPRGPVPVPSVADIGFLAFGPLAIAGLLLRLPRRTGRRSAAEWIDGVAAALAVTAVSAAIMLDAALTNIGADGIGFAVLVAYPISDAVMIGIVVASLALNRWRVDRASALVAAGLAAFWLADSTFLLGQANSGSTTELSPFVGLWSLAVLLFAFGSRSAVRQANEPRLTAPSASRTDIWSPLAFAAASLAIMVVAVTVQVNALAVVLAGLSLAAMLLRLGISLTDNARMLNDSRRDASTDALTGIGNRRALLHDLEHAIASGRTTTLVLFDLDGFKGYNDVFGHPAGDALLERLGHSLADRVARSGGGAYRIGGDEFCALIHGAAGAEQLAHLADALSESGEGFQIGASLGAVQLPPEAGTAADALRLVDQRMYACKNSKRASARAQSSEVLIRALGERVPAMVRHLRSVAAHAALVAAEVGLDAEAVERTRQAAMLHDIGCMSVPDAILHKPGRLDDDEQAFIREHPVAGARILDAAPALRHLAPIVRTIHERVDGGGYPDRLSGEQIPVESRIIAVCDAFDTMVEGRPFRDAISERSALAELQAHAGTQFDRTVVEALQRVASRGAHVDLAA